MATHYEKVANLHPLMFMQLHSRTVPVWDSPIARRTTVSQSLDRERCHTAANPLVESSQDESMLFNSGSEDKIILHTPISQRTAPTHNLKRSEAVIQAPRMVVMLLSSNFPSSPPPFHREREASHASSFPLLPPMPFFPTLLPHPPPHAALTLAPRDLNTKIDSPRRHPEIWRVHKPVLALPLSLIHLASMHLTTRGSTHHIVPACQQCRTFRPKERLKPFMSLSCMSVACMGVCV